MSRELDALTVLAQRRYQDTPAVLAVMQFESDRRRAGLGALDERRRGRAKGSRSSVAAISNTKWIDPLKTDRSVTYEQWLDVANHQRIQPQSPAEASRGVFRHEVLPAFRSHLCLPVPAYLFRDQRGRAEVAAMLRDLRAQRRRRS